MNRINQKTNTLSFNSLKTILFSLAIIAVCTSLQFTSCKKDNPDVQAGYTLKVTKTGQGTVTATWTEGVNFTDAQLATGIKLPEGAIITLTATPGDNLGVSWVEDPNIFIEGNEASFMITADQNVQVNFLPFYSLTLPADITAYSDNEYTKSISDLTHILANTKVYLKTYNKTINTITGIDANSLNTDKTTATITLSGNTTITGTFDVLDYTNFTFSSVYNGTVFWTGYTGTATSIKIPPIYNGAIVDGISFYSTVLPTTLKSIYIPNSIKNLETSGLHYTELTTITIDSSNPLYSVVNGNILFNKAMDTLLTYLPANTATSYTIPSSVKYIAERAFSNCTNLTNITIPGSVTTIEVNAFADCINLTNMTINNGIKNIGMFAFSGCEKLTSLTIPNSVTTIGANAFQGCRALATVVLPNTLSSIGDYTFYACNSLNGITIPSTVTTIGANAFLSCTSLTNITIPSAVTSIGQRAFVYCSALTTVTVQRATTPLTTLGEYAFDNKSGGVGAGYSVTIKVPTSQVDNYSALPNWGRYSGKIVDGGF